MMNGGASLEYFKRFADDPKNTIVFVGYNSVSSLGRRVQNGLKEVPFPDEDGYRIVSSHHWLRRSISFL